MTFQNIGVRNCFSEVGSSQSVLDRTPLRHFSVQAFVNVRGSGGRSAGRQVHLWEFRRGSRKCWAQKTYDSGLWPSSFAGCLGSSQPAGPPLVLAGGIQNSGTRSQVFSLSTRATEAKSLITLGKCSGKSVARGLHQQVVNNGKNQLYAN